MTTTTISLTLKPSQPLQQKSLCLAELAAAGSVTTLILGINMPLPLPTGELPFQPNITFPGRTFGTESFERSFQRSWFEKWRWLHYVKETACLFSVYMLLWDDFAD
ncbi:hypothetical protein ANANG_G00246810, partial [Anguilla anguilla]